MQEKFQGPNDILLAKELLQTSSGIEVADYLSIRHIELALESLFKVKDKTGRFVLQQDETCYEDAHLQALIKLAVLVKTRKY